MIGTLVIKFINDLYFNPVFASCVEAVDPSAVDNYRVIHLKLCCVVFWTDGVIALDDINDGELDRSYLASNPVNVDSGNMMLTD